MHGVSSNYAPMHRAFGMVIEPLNPNFLWFGSNSCWSTFWHTWASRMIKVTFYARLFVCMCFSYLILSKEYETLRQWLPTIMFTFLWWPQIETSSPFFVQTRFNHFTQTQAWTQTWRLEGKELILSVTGFAIFWWLITRLFINISTLRNLRQAHQNPQLCLGHSKIRGMILGGWSNIVISKYSKLIAPTNLLYIHNLNIVRYMCVSFSVDPKTTLPQGSNYKPDWLNDRRNWKNWYDCRNCHLLRWFAVLWWALEFAHWFEFQN